MKATSRDGQSRRRRYHPRHDNANARSQCRPRQAVVGRPNACACAQAAGDNEYARSARHLLPSPEELSLTPPYERVLHAILDLANGDWRLVRHHSQAARADWRDVLLWSSQASP
jgi:hypothetical protein